MQISERPLSAKMQISIVPRTESGLPCIHAPGKGNKLAECNVDVIEVPGGQLHADILSSITDIGRERVIQYFIENSVSKLRGSRTGPQKL